MAIFTRDDARLAYLNALSREALIAELSGTMREAARGIDDEEKRRYGEE